MAYSCNYPIEYTFTGLTINQTVDFSILVNGITIYTGVLLPYNAASTTLTIDISPQIRSYLETFYENIILNTSITSLPSQGNKSSLNTFTLRDQSGNDVIDTTFKVVYDYNTDYIQPLPDIAYLNDPIDTILDPRQKVFASGYNLNGSQTYTASINGTQVSQGSQNTSSINMFPYDLESNISLKEGDKITMSMSNVDNTIYTVTKECPHRYALYYVNKYGGLDTLLCTGRDTESWSPTRTDVRLYNDRGNRLDWEQKRIKSEQDHQFELNTGLLTDEGASKIDNLIYSPKVFIHDLEKDTITSCLITNSSYSVKQRRYDRVVQYTINVKESQKQLRR